MPKTTKSGGAKASELPSTLRRSPKKAQRTFAKAHDSAANEYGDEKRANQVAWAAVKHSFEKVGPGRGWQEHEPGDQGRRGCQRHQDSSAVTGEEARRHRPLEDEEEGTGRRDPEGEQQEDGGRPEEVTVSRG